MTKIIEPSGIFRQPGAEGMISDFNAQIHA
jgi:hypothetical protein